MGFHRDNGLKRLGIFALIWLTAIISLYYVNHKPFEPNFAYRLVVILGQIGSSLWIILLSGGIGALLLPDLPLRPLTSMVLRAAFGFGIVSVALFIIGSVLGINPLIAWFMVIASSIIVGYRWFLRWVRSWHELIDLWRESQITGKLIATGTSVILAANLLIALAPPTRFDALVYHFALPKSYLNVGQIVYTPNNIFWGMPQSGEMLYTLAMALAGIETASVMSLSVALLALLGILGFVSERFTVKEGWIALACLLAGSTLAGSMPAGYVDWFALLFGFCAIVGLDQWCYSGGRKWLVLAGVYSGLAFSSKYTGGVLLLSGMGLILWHARFKLEEMVKGSITFLSSSIFISLAWWLKNYVATGNPFYPFFFPAGEMDAIRLAHYNLPPWGDIFESILLPIRATLTGVEGSPGYSASIGPLLLGFGGLLWLGWKKRSAHQQQTLKTGLIISVLGLVVWSIASRFSGYLIQSRLYFSLFPAFCTLAVGGYLAMGDIRWLGIRFGRVSDILILLVFGFGVLQVGLEMIRREALPTVFGLRTQEEYLDDSLGWYAPAMRAVSNLSDGSKVLMLWEPRSLYCLPKCHPDEVLDRWLRERRVTGANEFILKKWKENGFTHLLLNRFGADFVRQSDDRYALSDWQELEALLAEFPEPVNFGNAYYLYSFER